jgi:O-antigen ligase
MRLTRVVGRILFLIGTFLMVTGDWPGSTLLPHRWVVPFPFLAWPWLYLVLLTGSFALLAAGGALHPGRPAAADVLHTPIALLAAAFLLSLACSQVPSLSEWAFGCFLAVVAFTLTVSKIDDDQAGETALSITMAAAALFLAARVILWRLVEGLTVPAFHIPNNAWLGRIQLSWILNLLAPLLLARYFSERRAVATFYGATWILCGTAIYMIFSRAGVLVFPLTTAGLCLFNARYWRRFVPLLVGLTLVTVALVIVSPTLAGGLKDVFRHPGGDASFSERAGILRQALRIIGDHPIIGIGLGTYDDVAPSRYGPIVDPHFFRNGWHAHNTFLHIFAETGIIGFMAWCYLWFVITHELLRRRRHGDASAQLNSSALLCVLFGALVLSMSEAMTAARLYASLRMNLVLALLVTSGLGLTRRPVSVVDAADTAGNPAGWTINGDIRGRTSSMNRAR